MFLFIFNVILFFFRRMKMSCDFAQSLWEGEHFLFMSYCLLIPKRGSFTKVPNYLIESEFQLTRMNQTKTLKSHFFLICFSSELGILDVQWHYQPVTSAEETVTSLSFVLSLSPPILFLYFNFHSSLHHFVFFDSFSISLCSLLFVSDRKGFQSTNAPAFSALQHDWCHNL